MAPSQQCHFKTFPRHSLCHWHCQPPREGEMSLNTEGSSPIIPFITAPLQIASSLRPDQHSLLPQSCSICQFYQLGCIVVRLSVLLRRGGNLVLMHLCEPLPFPSCQYCVKFLLMLSKGLTVHSLSATFTTTRQ